MQNHCFFLFLLSQILSRDLHICCCRILGGRLVRHAPLGNLSTREVYQSCSVPLGQENFLLSLGWGIIKQLSNHHTNCLFLFELFRFLLSFTALLNKGWECTVITTAYHCSEQQQKSYTYNQKADEDLEQILCFHDNGMGFSSFKLCHC